MSYTPVTLPHASQPVNDAGFCGRVNGIWFVCLDTSNDLMFSTSNGAIWSKADDSETTHTGVVTFVGWDGTRYVRIRGGLMAYSTDLQAWTAKASPFAVATWPARMAWNGTNWCTAGRAESGTQYIAYATDPTGTWTKQSTGLTSTPGTTVAWFDSTWWLGSTNAVEKSTNLTSWSTSISWSVSGIIDLHTDGTALFCCKTGDPGYLRKWVGARASSGTDGWEFFAQATNPGMFGMGVVNGKFCYFSSVAKGYIHSEQYSDDLGNNCPSPYVENWLGSTWSGTSKTLSAVAHGGSAFIQFIEDSGTPHQVDHVTPVEVTNNLFKYFRLSRIQLSSGTALKISDIKLMFDGTRVAQQAINVSTDPSSGAAANLIDGNLSTYAEWTAAPPEWITTQYTTAQKLNQVSIGTADASAKQAYTYALDGSMDNQRYYRLAGATQLTYPGNNAYSTTQGFQFPAVDTGVDYHAKLVAKTAPTTPTLGGGDYYEAESFRYVNGYWIIAYFDTGYTSTPAYYSANLTTWTSLGDAGSNGWGGVWYANGLWFKFTDTLYSATSLAGSWTAVALPSGWTFINDFLGYFDGFYWMRKGTGSTSYAYSADLINWAFRDPTAQVQQRLPLDATHTPFWITASGVSATKVVGSTGSGTTITYATELISEAPSSDSVTVYSSGLHHYAVRINAVPTNEYAVFRFDQTSQAFVACPTPPSSNFQVVAVTSDGRLIIQYAPDMLTLWEYRPGSTCWKEYDFGLFITTDEGVFSWDFAGPTPVLVTQDYTAHTIDVFSFVDDTDDALTEAADASDELDQLASFYSVVREGVRSTTSATLQAAYSQALTETALGQVVVASGKYFEDLITEAITGNVGMALALGAQLIEQAQAADVPASLRQLVVDVAEVIVALASLSVGQTYDFLETASANDTVADRITALALVLESILASDTPDAALTLMSVVREDAEATDTPTPLAAYLALITEAANAGVLLKLGDDYYVGWVLNPEGMQTKNGPAPTVSQYQNYPFNSLAKIGSRYFAAGAEGLYELTGSNDAGAPIIGYFKSGKLDFGSAMQKRVDSAYFAVATDGTVRLKVVTHDNGENLETWYEVVSRDAGEVAENIRIKLGKGLRSRYWQFELVVEDASHFELEEMQLIPMMLTRRL